MSLTGFEFERI